MIVRRCLLLLAGLLLAGCETSPAWYMGHPDRRVVTIESAEISVVPRRANEFDAYGGDTGAETNTARLKILQTRAIETVSGCKVAAAEYIPGTWTLQSVVRCGDIPEKAEYSR